MGWDWAIRFFDAWERVKVIAGWLGYSGLVSGLAGAVWAWAIGMIIWWPLFAAMGVGSFCFVKAGFICLQVQRLKLNQEQTAATLAPAIVASVTAILEKRQEQKELGIRPDHYVLKAETGTYTVTPGNLGFQVGPAPFIPLRDAMVKAYDLTKTGALGAFAEGSSDDADEILNWYAYFSVKHLPMYGKRHPDTSLEQIDQGRINRFYFWGGAKELHTHGKRALAYSDLSVRPEEVTGFLQRICEIDAEFTKSFNFDEEGV